MKLSVIVGCILLLSSWCLPVYSSQLLECDTASDMTTVSLPEREGPRIQTSGSVPHVQIGVEPVDEVNKALYQLAFTLPGVEERPTIVSLAGTIGMWLGDNIPVVNRKAIVAGREFSHIHTDGSLHTPLPLERALELEKKGWGERHPWADRNDGWEGLVMLYSAKTMDELKTVFQLITESYNYVTGQNLPVPDC